MVKGPGGKFVSFSFVVNSILLVSFLVGSCRKLPIRLAVCEVQGTGLESPYMDQEVIISGLVIADLEGVEPGGFMLLDEACPLTGEGSRALFVSLREGGELVDLGDEIRLQGVVREFEGETRLEAKLSGMEFLSLGNPLPGKIDLNAYLIPPMSFGYERWEGHLVAIPRAELIMDEGDTGRFRVIPQVGTDPSIQLICFQEESFSLGIDQDLLNTSKKFLHAGYELEELVGLIRQDKEGYYLQLVEEPTLRLLEQEPQEGSFPKGPANLLENPSGLPATPTITPTITPEPSPTVTATSGPTFIPAPTIIPTPTYYPIRLLIAEVLPNPAGEEPGGEWIEIYNPVGGKLPLDGIKIGDEVSPAGKEGMLRFPEGFSIYGGQVLVIANQASFFESQYGFLPDFELVDSISQVPDLIPYAPWGRSIVKLSNAGDEVLLVDPWDQVVDLVVYGKEGTDGFSPPVPAPEEGHSLERYPPEGDTDQAGDWRERGLPSPGRLDRSPPTQEATPTLIPSPSQTCSFTPAAATPILTLVTATSSLTPSATSTAICTCTSTPSHTHTAPFTLTPTCTQTGTSLPSDTPEMTVSPTSSTTTSPTISISATSTSTIDPITMTPSPTKDFTSIPAETPTPSLTSVMEETPTPSPRPEIVINEIHADPDPIQGDSNGDGQISSDDDEFLELVNISGRILDLSGWEVFDEIRLRYTFPDGTSLAPGCGLVLFGGGEPSGEFGGSLVFTAGSLGLNNAGDLVRLLDPDGTEKASVRYGPEGNQDQSLTRDPDLLGPLPLVLHSQLPGSEGALYSPGTRIDGTVFGSCP